MNKENLIEQFNHKVEQTKKNLKEGYYYIAEAQLATAMGLLSDIIDNQETQENE